MKAYGKVVDYDGYTGTIKGVDGYSYILLSKDVRDEDIRVGDYVLFEGDVYKDVEFTKYIARFVKKVKKD